MAELLVILLITAVVTAATKSGRAAVKNFATSAHKATGWRTPKAALHHYSGRLGALAGRRTATTARSGRKAVARTGRHATAVAGRRWQARQAASAAGPLFWRTRPQTTGNGNNGTAPAGNSPTAVVSGTGSPIPAGNGSAAGGTNAAGTAGTPAVVSGNGAAPADTARQTAPSAGTGTSSGPATPSPTATTAPAGAERRRNRMTTRYALNLEPPQTDGEFLESCVQLGDVLKSLAEEISNWADGLGALNLPQSVLNPLHQVSDGITDAAAGATQAAKAFEDEFEDARDVAARGMHFTGQDAA
jgi:hypothetical protein